MLLIEDDADTLEMYAYVLRAEAFHVIAARSTTEAIAISAQQRPSIVVTDLFVPGSLSAVDLCRQFSEDGVPVIAVTGVERGPMHDQMRQAGCAAVLVKPVSPETLVTEVRRVLAAWLPTQIGFRGTETPAAKARAYDP